MSKDSTTNSHTNYKSRNDRNHPYSYALAVKRNLNGERYNFAALDNHPQSKQNARLLTIEAAIRDFRGCIKQTASSLSEISAMEIDHDAEHDEKSSLSAPLVIRSSNSNPSQTYLAKIVKTIDGHVKTMQQDSILSLLDICSDPAALMTKLVREGFPDPMGIIGNNQDEGLAKKRQGEFLRDKMLTSFASRIPGQAVAIGGYGAQQLMLPEPNNMISQIVGMKFNDVEVINCRRENFICELKKQLAEHCQRNNVVIDDRIISAYVDAADSMFDRYAGKADAINPIELAQNGKNEFIQNLRIIIIDSYIDIIKEIVKDISINFKHLNGTQHFNQQVISSYSMDYIAQEFSSANNSIDAREGRQNAKLRKAAADMVNIADYFLFVANNFSDKLGANLSPEFTAIGLAFGADPDTRPQDGFKHDIERNTLLHIAASKGDAITSRNILNYGGNVNAKVVPMQSWGEWLYTWFYPLKSVFAYIRCERLPTLEGETPLLYAAKNLVNCLKENKKTERDYLDTVITHINYGADLLIHNKKAQSPSYYLDYYIKQHGDIIKDYPSKNASREQIINALTTIKINLDHQLASNVERHSSRAESSGTMQK